MLLIECNIIKDRKLPSKASMYKCRAPTFLLQREKLRKATF